MQNKLLKWNIDEKVLKPVYLVWYALRTINGAKRVTDKSIDKVVCPQTKIMDDGRCLWNTELLLMKLPSKRLNARL